MRGAALALGLAVPAAAAEVRPGELAQALADLPPAQVVILGEVHDNPHHHVNQAAAVAAMQPSALVFEMLTAAQATLVTPAVRGDAEALAEVLDWADSGWPDFGMYHPIFTAAPDAAIYGAAVPRDAARGAFDGGAAEAFGPEAGRFGLDVELPAEEQAAREAEQMAAHCDALPPGMLPGFVAAQRLRDAELARAALRALTETGGPVAVITGNGHARLDQGMAPYLRAAAPEVRVLAVGQFETPPDGVPPFDLWLVTEPAERPDPCAAFR